MLKSFEVQSQGLEDKGGSIDIELQCGVESDDMINSVSSFLQPSRDAVEHKSLLSMLFRCGTTIPNENLDGNVTARVM